MRAADRAQRKNADKRRYDLLPFEWEQELAEILTRGARKYADNNWKNSLNTESHDAWIEKCYASARRHIEAWRRGERIDPELGTSHMGMASWNFMVIFWYQLHDTRGVTDAPVDPRSGPQVARDGGGHTPP